MFYRRGSGEEERRDRPEGRFRDGRGRERYNDGRYAPRSDGDYDRRYRDEPMGRRYDIEPRGGGRSREPGSREMGHIGFEQQQDDDDRLSWEEAEQWVGGMKNADGTVGAKWAPDHVLKMMHERGIDCDPIEFWCAMNAVYSDFARYSWTTAAPGRTSTSISPRRGSRTRTPCRTRRACTTSASWSDTKTAPAGDCRGLLCTE